jgi:hypothetical protein
MAWRYSESEGGIRNIGVFMNPEWRFDVDFSSTVHPFVLTSYNANKVLDFFGLGLGPLHSY